MFKRRDVLNLPGHEVLNPVALRILRHIIRRYRINYRPDTGELIRQVRYEDKLPTSGNLWGRLALSDLTERLAGQVQLPDVYEAMPRWAANWYRLFRPKTLEQQVDQVILHLDWFTTPDRFEPYTKPLEQGRNCLVMLAFIVGMVLLTWLAVVMVSKLGLPLIMVLLLLVVVLVPVWFALGLSRFTTNTEEEFTRIRKRNATVLYHFLLKRFSEPMEDSHG